MEIIYLVYESPRHRGYKNVSDFATIEDMAQFVKDHDIITHWFQTDSSLRSEGIVVSA